jgi:hypothetical protein
MHLDARTFPEAWSTLRVVMKGHGRPVTTETWQGVDVRQRPDAATYELLNVTLTLDLRGEGDVNTQDPDVWRQEIRPNLPWADDHFAERVSGSPLNPPPSWAWWPWAGSAAKHRNNEEKFNHTYPERYWPKYAGERPGTLAARDGSTLQTHYGIRSAYGDLDDLVTLLVQQPHTRQAYLPIFFPEDTGVGDGGRKPCTLGYQFILREGGLHCFYPMRSCDLVRHFRDDVYLTIRLMLWIIEQCRHSAYGCVVSPVWETARLASLTMHMTSLHIFENDRRAL